MHRYTLLTLPTSESAPLLGQYREHGLCQVIGSGPAEPANAPLGPEVPVFGDYVSMTRPAPSGAISPLIV